MKFAFIQKGQYKVGQVIDVQGVQMQVESYSHTGKNVVVHSMPDAARFSRVVCICTDEQPIEEQA